MRKVAALVVVAVVAVAVGASLAACADDAGSVTSTAPTTEPGPTGSGSDRVVPEGFERVAATVTTADGTVCELCLWLAETGAQRQRGLMFVTDLGPADGMAFRYDAPYSSTFWMKNTVLPLSIAFFDPEGAFMDAFDMAPCTADPCLHYRTPRDFLVAVEVPRGGLAELGIAEGSVLALSDLPCADA